MNRKRFTSNRTEAEAYDLKRMKADTEQRKYAGLPKGKKRWTISETRIRALAVHCLSQVSANGIDDAMLEMGEKREAHANVERLEQ